MPKQKREKGPGVFLPPGILNFTTEEALDKLAEKYYGTPTRRSRSVARRERERLAAIVPTPSVFSKAASFLKRAWRRIFPGKPLLSTDAFIWRVTNCRARREAQAQRHLAMHDQPSKE